MMLFHQHLTGQYHNFDNAKLIIGNKYIINDPNGKELLEIYCEAYTSNYYLTKPEE